MKKILFFLLILVTLFTGCSHTEPTTVASAAQVIIKVNGEEVSLIQPAIIKNDVVYISLEDFGNLPGIEFTYKTSTGEITATRHGIQLVMHIDEPIKPDDVNGPTPFLYQNKAYLPLCDAISYLEYHPIQDTLSDGTIVITLEKQGYDAEDMWRPFSATELAAAAVALEAGVTIDDPESDWALISEGVQPDGRTDNDNPYPLPFTDVKSVTFGADYQYLYLKVEFYDVIPKDVVYWDNEELNEQDFITGMACNLALTHFFNRNIGQDDEGLMQLGLSYIVGNIHTFLENPAFYIPPAVCISNFATPSGAKDEYNEDIYLVSNSNGRVAGGAGTNYLLGAFPLSEYGLRPGDTIEFNLSVEVGSLLFHHECVDVILDCGLKAGETIRYQLGSNTYENLGPPEL
jgi:hypothetical protein